MCARICRGSGARARWAAGLARAGEAAFGEFLLDGLVELGWWEEGAGTVLGGRGMWFRGGAGGAEGGVMVGGVVWVGGRGVWVLGIQVVGAAHEKCARVIVG